MKKFIFLLLILLFLASCDNQADNELIEDNSNQIDDTNDTTEHKVVKAVWWWDDELSFDYLDFAKANDINTIYYCSSKFNESTAEFIKKANDYEMSVYLLSGDYTWILDPTGLNNLITRFEEYQNNNIYKFAGIHLDIEPHQHEEFSVKREELIKGLINIAIDLSSKNYRIEYDIPFWLNDEISINNEKKEAYKWLIDYADSITIMSYRDTKDAIIDVAIDEINYANSINKSIMLSVETYSLEGDHVSFYEEGKTIMMDVVNSIYDEEIPGVGGIAIHHIERWFELKD